MTTPTKPTKEATTPLPVLTEERVKEIRDIYSGTDHDLARDVVALADHWLRTQAEQWQPIETAPRGGGADMVTDHAWVDPPEILLLFPPAKKATAAQAVGVWDWYYAPGGNGYAGVSAWISPASGDLLAMYYGEPTHWRPLPDAPPQEPA